MPRNVISEVVVNGNTYELDAADAMPSLATVEPDATSASKAYSVGDHVVVNDIYYKVIDSISAGDAFVVNTNIEVAKVGDEIEQVNDNLTAEDGLEFKFRKDANGKRGYLDENGDFCPFSSGAIYLGQYSANATIDVSALGATSVNQFIAVPQAVNYSRQQGQGSGVYTLTYVLNNPVISLSNGTLSLTVATGSANYGAVTIPCKLYYVGDIESAS